MLAVPWGLLGSPTASASPARPHTSGSYYINSTSTTTAYNKGCANGKYATTNNFDRLDILDFGGQVSGGAELINGDIVSTSQIEAVVESWTLGEYECSSS